MVGPRQASCLEVTHLTYQKISKARGWEPVLQPHRWRCVKCVIHHERDVREEQQYIYVARTSNNRVIMTCELYCCLLPQCEALRIWRSGFSDRNTSSLWNDRGAKPPNLE